MNKSENLSYKIKIAGKPERLVNYIIDTVIILTFSSLFGMFFIFSAYDVNSMSFLIYLIIHTLYYSLFEFISGQTIGKMITNTKIIRRGNAKLNFNKILVRTFSRLLPFDIQSYIFGTEIGMHDQLSNTIVIKIAKN